METQLNLQDLGWKLENQPEFVDVQWWWNGCCRVYIVGPNVPNIPQQADQAGDIIIIAFDIHGPGKPMIYTRSKRATEVLRKVMPSVRKDWNTIGGIEFCE